MDQARKKEALERIAARWNQQAIPCSVVHGVAGYPPTVGRDLDVLLSADRVGEAFAVAESSLRQAGCAIAVPPPIWGKRVVGVFDQGQSFESAELHFLPKL